MTNQQILEKAIQKAIEGGWKSDYEGFELLPPDKLGMVKWRYWMDMGNEQIANVVYSSYKDMLFDRDFAKALWPRGEYKKGELAPYGIGTNHDGIKAEWQYHLQNMVIADDPIEYLGNNL